MTNDYDTKKSKLKEDLQKIKEDFLSLKEAGGEAFEQDAQDLKENIGEFYDNFKDSAGDVIDGIKSNIPKYQEQVKEQLAKAGDEVSDAIRRKPVEALAIAGLVGLVAGIVLSRK